jgi:RNA polymerase sigma-70 factor (ECF subfamily)
VNKTVNIKLLVKRLIENDKNALDGLYHYYYPRLYYFIKGFLKVEDEVDDVIQDVFVKLWENRNNITSVETFNSWVFTVTKNEVISLFRSKIKKAEFETRIRETVIQTESFTDTMLEYNEIKGRVDQLIEQLPEKRRQIFKLSREQGLSQKEIANQLGISVKTVEDHMMHAIRFMRENLKSSDLITLLYLAIFF